jgi:protocatechuate 3,4-dioxygenase beta subunit
MPRRCLLPPVSVFALTVIMLLFLGLPVMAQDPPVQSTWDVYFARLEPVSDSTGDPASGYRAAYQRLEPMLRQLSADGQIAAYEYLPEISSVRLIASQEVVTKLAARPEVARVEPLHRIPIPTQSAPVPVDAAPPVTESPPEAAPASPTPVPEPVISDAPPLVPAPTPGDAAASQPSEPGLTYTISGTVRDYDGTAVKDAWVSTDSSDPMYASAMTGAGGNYTLNVNAGTYHISVYKYGLPAPPKQTVTVPPNQTVNITFPQRYTISGKVLDWDSTPIAGASVSTKYGDPVSANAQTDATGAYALTVLAGAYHVSVHKSGLPNLPEQTVTVPPNQVLNITYPQRYTISGKVLDWDGTPIKDAWVSTDSDDPAYASANTDATGSYVLTVIALGTYHVKVSKYPLAAPPEQTVTIPPSQVVNFTFPTRYTISGKVLDWDGTPIAGASVSTKYGDPVSASAQTDATGAYALTVLAGTYHVSVYKSGLPNLPEQTVTVPPSQVVNFTYPARYTISGKVLDWDGTPIAGASVSTKYSDPVSASAQTDATGAYALTVLAGTYHVSVYKSGLPNLPEQTVTVPPNQVVNFTYPARYTISGKVLDWDGMPIAGASVSTKYSDPVSASAQTDATGAYALTVLAGTYHVSVYKSGLPNLPEQTVTVPPNQVVNFSYPRRYTIRGTVRNYDNTPVKDVSVSTDWNDPVHAYAQTDASGAYSLVVTAGTYTIDASKSGYPNPPKRTVTVPPDASGVDFTFPQPYPISGTVRDGSGKPVQGATIWGGLNSVTTAADGTYTAMAGPGEHYVSAQKNGYQPAPSVIVPVPPAASGVDFVLLVRDQTIRGRVVDNQGRPLGDASVSGNSIICGNWGSANTRASADGTYTLTVPSGTYHVTATKDGYAPAPPELAKVPVTEAQSAAVTVDFTLEPLPFTIRGTVRDSLGQPIDDAWVRASACGLSYGTETDATGTYTLTVNANTFSVSASKSGYLQEPLQIVPVPPNAEHVDFTLRARVTYTITGRVTDPQGAPLEDAYVRTASGGPDYDSDNTDATGKYTLQVLAGTYQILAEKEGYARVKRAGITVPPNQSGIDLVLPPVDLKIQGTVRDTAGRGVPDAWVCPTPSGESSSYLCRSTYYNGTYTKFLPAGTYRVSASASCYAYASISNVTLPPSKTGLDFTIRLYDQLIAGRATDTDGQPVCGASVTAKDGITESDSTARNGRYAIQVPAGTYKVSAAKDGYTTPGTKNVTVPPSTTTMNFVFQAPNKSTVQGIVRDKRGASMAGVSVIAAASSGSAATVTGADGSYTLRLVDGSWSITASKPDYLAFPSTQAVVTPPNRTGLNFTLIPRSEIKSVYLPVLLRSR